MHIMSSLANSTTTEVVGVAGGAVAGLPAVQMAAVILEGDLLGIK